MATTSRPSSERGPAASDGDLAPELAGEGAEEGQAHLKDYLQVILARRWFLVAFFVIVVGAVAVNTYTQVPVFKASALILIEPKQINVTNVKDLYDPTGGASFEYLKTQHQLLASRRIGEPVLSDLGLDQRYGLGGFLGSIVVEPLQNTRLVNVGFLSTDPEEAARVANALVAAYVRDNRQRSLGVSDAGLKDLRERAKELRIKVDHAGQALEAFQQKHRLVTFGESESVLAARLSALNAELARAQTARIQAQAELETLETTREAAPPAAAPAGDQEAFSAQRREIATLEAELRSMSLRVKADHPIRAAHEARLAAAREELVRLRAEAEGKATAALEGERARLGAAARGRLEAATKAEAALRGEIDAQTGKLLESEQQRREYRMLSEAHETVNATYRSVMQRIEEIELAAASETKDNNVFVIDRAEVPLVPISPNKRKNLTFAMIAGLAGGIGLCFLVDYLDRSIKTKDDVERLLQLPVLGNVPLAEDPRSRATDELGPVEVRSAEDPRSMLAEAFRTIRTGVSFGLMRRSGETTRKLVVTSALPGDGKTLVSVNLAIALAQLGKRVLLVDADMRKPRLSSVLGLEANGNGAAAAGGGGAGVPGLSGLLAGEEPLERLAEAARPLKSVLQLAVLPSGPVPPNPADLLNGERMDALLRACDGQFDWVILDAPPAALADPTILSTHVGSVLFVVRSFRTPRELARRACRGIGAVGARVVGVVLNDVDLPAGTHGYGYGYYGYGRYGYGYGYHQDGEPNGHADGSGPANGHGNGKARTPITTSVLRRLGLASTPAGAAAPPPSSAAPEDDAGRAQ